MKNIIIQHQLSNSCIKRFEYLIDFINHHPLKPKALRFIINNGQHSPDITYGLMTKQSLFIPYDTSNNFLDSQNHHSKTPHFFDQPIQSFFANLGIKNQSFIKDNKTSFDIFNFIFYIISRYEEVFAESQNISSIGWLDEPLHFLVKNKIQDIPVVDVLLAAFFERFIDKKINTPTRYNISHDIDVIFKFTPYYKFLRTILASIYHKRGINDIYKTTSSFLKTISQKQKDPYDCFDVLFKKDKTWQDKTVYFMTGGNTRYDNFYNITDNYVQNTIQLAKSRDYQIGLHPSYNAGFNEKMFQIELNSLEQSINQKITFNRQHFLRWSWDRTPFILERNNIQVDSSMGYNTYLGFRCGTGFSYYLYNFKKERSFNWVEQPMSLMESAAIQCGLREHKNIVNLVSQFIQNNKFNTEITINFHNSNFDEALPYGYFLHQFYEKEMLNLCYG